MSLPRSQRVCQEFSVGHEFWIFRNVYFPLTLPTICICVFAHLFVDRANIIVTCATQSGRVTIFLGISVLK